jgi:hypothetical protein
VHVAKTLPNMLRDQRHPAVGAARGRGGVRAAHRLEHPSADLVWKRVTRALSLDLAGDGLQHAQPLRRDKGCCAAPARRGQRGVRSEPIRTITSSTNETGEIHDVPWDKVQVCNIESLRGYEISTMHYQVASCAGHVRKTTAKPVTNRAKQIWHSSLVQTCKNKEKEVSMLTVGDKFPSSPSMRTFQPREGQRVQDRLEQDFAGKWLVFYAYPKDFTFICPTEIVEFGKHAPRFRRPRRAVVSAARRTTSSSHLAWRKASQGSRGPAVSPMIS